MEKVDVFNGHVGSDADPGGGIVQYALDAGGYQFFGCVLGMFRRNGDDAYLYAKLGNFFDQLIRAENFKRSPILKGSQSKMPVMVKLRLPNSL